jgi:cobalt/nickel transport system permease protein
MHSLESCAQSRGPLQAFHPALKIVMTLGFVLCVMSCNRQETVRLLPFILVLCLFLGMSAIPMSLYFRRLCVALPFAVFAGVWGCFWDFELFCIWGMNITGGVLSLISIFLRTLLCVGAILVLMGTTSLRDLAKGMRQLKMPAEMVQIFELMCRYLGILIDEVKRLKMAWELRGGSRRGVMISRFGSFAGGLLIRSFQRASSVYHAMLCRGYEAGVTQGSRWPAKYRKPTFGEWGVTVMMMSLCILIRFWR